MFDSRLFSCFDLPSQHFLLMLMLALQCQIDQCLPTHDPLLYATTNSLTIARSKSRSKRLSALMGWWLGRRRRDNGREEEATDKKRSDVMPTYVCVCVCIRARMRVCLTIRISAFVQAQAHRWVYIRVCVCVYLHTRVRVCVCASAHVRER